MDSALEWITELLILDEGQGSLAGLLFLTRRYPDRPSPRLHAGLERALGQALVVLDHERDAPTRCRCLGALADVAVMTADGTLQDLVTDALPDVIDGIEALMRRTYEPGEGAVGESVDRHMMLSLALLTAFDLTARLPYAMLAEELLQTATRTQWNAGVGQFNADSAANCRAVQVCCRLAALHRDADYTARAVLAPEARYQERASIILQALDQTVPREPVIAAEYGLALLDAFALNALPN